MKKVQSFIKTKQEAWLKLYIDIRQRQDKTYKKFSKRIFCKMIKNVDFEKKTVANIETIVIISSKQPRLEGII